MKSSFFWRNKNKKVYSYHIYTQNIYIHPKKIIWLTLLVQRFCRIQRQMPTERQKERQKHFCVYWGAYAIWVYPLCWYNVSVWCIDKFKKRKKRKKRKGKGMKCACCLCVCRYTKSKKICVLLPCICMLLRFFVLCKQRCSVNTFPLIINWCYTIHPHLLLCLVWCAYSENVFSILLQRCCMIHR